MRVYNFSAGPAVLPEEVLREAADEMLDYKGTGMSVMEMSHRSKAYDAIIKEAEKDIREIMNIPDNYKVLFLQGGASQQFAAVPMNLMKNKKAAYIITGQWAKKAYQEAQKYGEAVAVASSADKTFSYIPDCSDLDIPEDADYVYICENNTIYGTKYKTLPNTKGHTLVADVSSCFLSDGLYSVLCSFNIAPPAKALYCFFPAPAILLSSKGSGSLFSLTFCIAAPDVFPVILPDAASDDFFLLSESKFPCGMTSLCMTASCTA